MKTAAEAEVNIAGVADHSKEYTESDGGSLTSDNAALAALGYKQEFKRHFTPLEVWGLSFSIIGIFPSIASVSLYS